ncbi:hypothetical protein [Gorillibacterium sp. CAU 1737]|uniref:hypothetical protein n=1 Tax=Gorillibacterium sp. CAU 1737 TaxID=3140362 RepID=UPI003260F501
MIRYDQKKCEQLISQMLIEQGFLITRTSSDLPKYSIQAIKGDKKVYILVRHLEFDNAYNESILPYQVYKIQAFNDDEEKNKGRHSLHFVVGYNFRDTSFACVPIDEFFDKRSTVVHQREGLRAVYYNNWNALKEYVV